MSETIVPSKNLTTVEVDSPTLNFGPQHPASHGVKLAQDYRGCDFVSLGEAMMLLPGDAKARADRAGGAKS